jgi:hypothetical protein
MYCLSQKRKMAGEHTKFVISDLLQSVSSYHYLNARDSSKQSFFIYCQGHEQVCFSIQFFVFEARHHTIEKLKIFDGRLIREQKIFLNSVIG